MQYKIMSGLNYGNSYRQTKRKNKFNQCVEGVSYAEIIKKWLVRININNKLSSIGAYNTKKEAEKIYFEQINKIKNKIK